MQKNRKLFEQLVPLFIYFMIKQVECQIIIDTAMESVKGTDFMNKACKN